MKQRSVFRIPLRFTHLCSTLLILLWGLPYGKAQTFTKRLQSSEYLIQAKLFTEADGIPHWHLSGLFQDSRGFIWGDWKGALCRFDGRQFEVVHQRQEPLHQFGRTSFAEDLQNNIWQSYTYGNISQISIYNVRKRQAYTLADYIEFQGFSIPEELNEGVIELLSIDGVIFLIKPTGSIWSYDGALNHLSKGIAVPEILNLQRSIDVPPSSSGIEIAPAPNNHYWVIHPKQGVYLFDSTGQIDIRYTDLTPDQYSFSLDHSLRLLCFNTLEEDMMVLDLSGTPSRCSPWASQVQFSFLNNKYPYIFGAVPGTKGAIWLNRHLSQLHFVDQGSTEVLDLLPLLQRYFPDQNLSDFFSVTRNFSYPPFRVLSDGTILLHRNGALLQINIKKALFTSILGGKSIRTIAYQDDHLYAAINYDNVMRFPAGKGEPEVFYPKRLPILSMLPQEEGIWFGSSRSNLGVISYSGDLSALYDPPIWDGISEVKSLLVRENDVIWFGCSKGLVSLDLQSKEWYYLIEDIDVSYLHTDSQGHSWAGTSEGLYHTGSQEYYLDNLPDGEALVVNHIHEENPETYWLASNRGLVRWKPFSEEYTLYTREDGLSDNIIHAVYPDSEGHLWLSTNNGITYFDPQTPQTLVYLEKDGLLETEHNQRAHARDDEGRLYFGSVNGIHQFHPDSMASGLEVLTCELMIDSLTQYRRDGEALETLYPSFSKTSRIRLSRQCQHLQLQMALPYYGHEDITVEWQLSQGDESHWQPLSDKMRLSIFKIPNRTFQINFRIRSQKSGHTIQQNTLTFHYPAPYFLHPIFWTVLFFIIIGLIAIVTELRTKTIQKNNQRLAAQVKEQTRQITKQNEQLKRYDATKTDLFNNISHELRTPLNIMQLQAESIEKEGPPQMMSYTSPIKEQIAHISNLVDQVLEFNKLELGIVPIKEEIIEWTSFVERQFNMLRGIADKKSIYYQLSTPDEPDIYLQVDIKKVETILNNLIGNALKFTPHHGSILVRYRFIGEKIEVAVADTGPGIPPEEQEAIFNKYYQGNNYTHQGYGIGLAICREYAQLLGGQLWVESIPEKGATFFFTFPKKIASPSDIPVARKAISMAKESPRIYTQITQEDHHLPNILLVEDNAQMLNLLERLLSENFQVTTATNGQDACKQLEKYPPAYFKVIVCDVMMPVMDGFSFLHKVRNHPELGFIPFLFITALQAKQDYLKAYRLGVDSLLRKPFDGIELKVRIRNLVNNQNKREQSAQLREQGEQASKESHKAASNSQPETAMESYEAEWLKALDRIVKKNLHRTDFKVSEIAHHLHISESTLRNRIKAYTGLTPLSYLKKCRLNQAMIYIENRKYKTIKEVSYAVGFKDDRYFSRIFKKEFGKTPGYYMTDSN